MKEVLRRRAMSVSGVAAVALGSMALCPVVIPILVVADLLRVKLRLPLARLYVFAACWAWLEVAGVSIAGGLWLSGRRRDLAAHHRLQTWWADKMMTALRVTCGLRSDVCGAETLLDGPTILFVRHASLADSLLTAWVITNAVGMCPRVVMKRELLVDPCLDIVGNRLVNCFVDRAAADSGPELASIVAMTSGLGRGDVAVLFPEGTRANPAKAARAVAAIARSDPGRAERVGQLVNLLPPRPGGAAAMLAAAPDAALCVGWHTGFEGLDTFGGIISALGRDLPPVVMRFQRVPRPVPTSDGGPANGGPADGITSHDIAPGDAVAGDVVAGDAVFAGEHPAEAFVEWLDGLWAYVDQRVSDQLGESRRGRP